LRRTEYRVGGTLVSRHLAALLVSACGAERLSAIEEGRICLAEVLAEPGVEKTDLHVEVAGSLVWRRYHVAIDGTPAGVVVEAVPCETWGRVLPQPVRPSPARSG
jgi:hypothetical protein